MSNNSETKFEKIGNVTLDLTYYPGEDFYCDGTVEDELLEIVKNHKPSEFVDVIEKEANWPVLYHLSPLRANIIDWFPVKEGSKVLEVGSGCGAITGALSKKAGELTCIDLSKKRSLINAYRNQEKDNICIKVGNFQDIEPMLDCDYDLICLIGVFEYAKGYIGNESPYTEFLNTIMKHCKPGGQVVIAIENRLGMKYFAGCREDHLADFFSGLEDYPNGGVVRTFSRPGLEKILSECNVKDYHFYYPYPDYKFANTIFSDKRLPNEGELTYNLRNFDRSRLLLFDEKNAFDSVIRDGEFPLFSNSYFLLIGPDVNVVYSKFSNDRSDEFAIRTDICEREVVTCDGLPNAQIADANLKRAERYVRKVPCSKKAAEHMDNIHNAGEMLKQRYADSDLQICPCEKSEIETYDLIFPYLQGQTLEEKLDVCLEKQDMDTFKKLFSKYFEFANYNLEIEVTDYDLIFSNILIDEEQWQLIDYEWTYTKKMPVEDIVKRALFCYRLGSVKRKALNIDDIVTEFGLGDYNEEELRKKELEFQNKVTGNHKSLSEMRDLINNEVLPITDIIYEQKHQKKMAQIYYDRGTGFSEEQSCFVVPYAAADKDSLQELIREKRSSGIELADEEGQMSGECIFKPAAEDIEFYMEVEIDKNVKNLRVDPIMEPCMITIHEAFLKGNDNEKFTNSPISLKKVISNGVAVGENTYVFAHNDPNFTFALDTNFLSSNEKNEFTISYSLVKLPYDMAQKFSAPKGLKKFLK